MKKIELASVSLCDMAMTIWESWRSIVVTIVNYDLHMRRLDAKNSNFPRKGGCMESVTHMPADARGAVNSNTRWPASRPSPSTDITTRSSEDIEPSSEPSTAFSVTAAIVGAKIDRASSLEQTIEHSTGVTETLRKGC